MSFQTRLDRIEKALIPPAQIDSFANRLEEALTRSRELYASGTYVEPTYLNQGTPPQGMPFFDRVRWVLAEAPPDEADGF
jgi:hypothetical protein